MRDKFAAKREENIRSKSRTKFAWEQQLSYLRIMIILSNGSIHTESGAQIRSEA